MAALGYKDLYLSSATVVQQYMPLCPSHWRSLRRHSLKELGLVQSGGEAQQQQRIVTREHIGENGCSASPVTRAPCELQPYEYQQGAPEAHEAWKDWRQSSVRWWRYHRVCANVRA